MVKKQRMWSLEEIEFLEANYPTFGSYYCSQNLNRSQPSIQGKAKRIGIKRDGDARYNRKTAPEGYCWCFSCDQILPDGFFYKKKKDGSYGEKANICRSCCQLKGRRNYNKHKERILSDSHKNPIKRLLENIRSKSGSNNIPFDLGYNDLVLPAVCPVLGIEIIPFDNSDNSPSVDRFIPELGYVKGNCRIISKRANRIKDNASLEEIEKLYFWMKNIHDNENIQIIPHTP